MSRPQRGFTLIEVLVALLVFEELLALMLSPSKLMESVWVKLLISSVRLLVLFARD